MFENQTDTPEGARPPLFQTLGNICVASAALGGIIILGAALVVTFSVIKSLVVAGAVRGEFELVELACTTCASLFLPLCQFNKGHVMVDVFTSWLPKRLNMIGDGLWTLAFAFAWAFLSWRVLHGLWEIQGYGDRTMLLRAPVWWAYVPAVFGTALSAIVALIQGISLLVPRFAKQEGV